MAPGENEFDTPEIEQCKRGKLLKAGREGPGLLAFSIFKETEVSADVSQS